MINAVLTERATNWWGGAGLSGFEFHF